MKDYPYNVRITIAGVDFTGPGMETEQEAEIMKSNVKGKDEVQNAEVLLTPLEIRGSTPRRGIPDDLLSAVPSLRWQ